MKADRMHIRIAAPVKGRYERHAEARGLALSAWVLAACAAQYDRETNQRSETMVSMVEEITTQNGGDTKMNTTNPRIVETAEWPAPYNNIATVMIVDDQRYGRLLVAQAFGGMDTLSGGKVSWRNGMVYRLADDATLASLQAAADKAQMAVWTYLHPFNPAAEILEWSGDAIQSYANAAIAHGGKQ